MRGDLQQPRLQAVGHFRPLPGVLGRGVQAALGAQAVALQHDDGAEEDHAAHQARHQGQVLGAAALDLRLLQILVAFEQRDLQLALLGAVAGAQLLHALPVVLVAHLLGRGRKLALVVKRGRQIAARLARQGELLVNVGQHLGAFQRARDLQGGLQVRERLVGPAGLPQHEGQPAVGVGDVTPVFQYLERGQRALEIIDRLGGIAAGVGDESQVGERLGDGPAIAVAFAEFQRLLVHGGGLVVTAEAKIIVAETVHQAGADPDVARLGREFQPELEMLQGVFVAPITLVGESQAAVRAGQNGVVGQLRGELEFLEMVFQRVGIVGEIPVEPAQQVEKIHLQAHVGQRARPGQAVPRPGQSGGIIAATPLEIDDGHEGAQRFQFGTGLGQGLLRGLPHLVAIGQLGIRRRGKRRPGIAHRARGGRLGSAGGAKRQQRKAGQEQA